MKITKEAVLKSLSRVEDPDLKKDLVTLGMIKDLEVNNTSISFSVVLTTPACPLKELIRSNCEKEIVKDFGEDIELLRQLN